MGWGRGRVGGSGWEWGRAMSSHLSSSVMSYIQLHIHLHVTDGTISISARVTVILPADRKFCCVPFSPM